MGATAEWIWKGGEWCKKNSRGKRTFVQCAWSPRKARANRKGPSRHQGTQDRDRATKRRGKNTPEPAKVEETNKSEPESPDPTAAADEAFVVLDEEPDYSGDEEPQPSSQRTWVYVRDLLDAAEGSPATAEDSTGAGGPAAAGSTACKRTAASRCSSVALPVLEGVAHERLLRCGSTAHLFPQSYPRSLTKLRETVARLSRQVDDSLACPTFS